VPSSNGAIRAILSGAYVGVIPGSQHYARANRSRFRLGRFELFFRVEGKLDHALEELIGRQSREILEHELFDVQAHEIAQL